MIAIQGAWKVMAIPFMKQFVWGLTLLAALGTRLSAGVFFAFFELRYESAHCTPGCQGNCSDAIHQHHRRESDLHGDSRGFSIY
jgi:hypothetical protein